MNILFSFFYFEWQFPAMNKLISLFLFWMAVPGREQISFTFAFISLLFLFSFHNKHVLFCFEKKKEIYFQFNKKQNQLTFYFIFNAK